MAYLLDTHLVLWAAIEPERLPAKARKLLENRQEVITFSLATIWEVAIKTSLKRADFSVDPAALHAGLLDAGFAELALEPTHLFRVATLPWVHRDPFDRLLVAQAVEEGLTLLSVDAALKGYGKFVKVL